MNFDFEIIELNGSCIFLLKGKLTNENDGLLITEKINALVSKGKCHFIFNLEELTSCNSSGLNIFIRTLTKTRTANGDLVLFGLNETLNKLFAITKINEIFSIYSDQESAVNHFNKTKE